MPKARLTSTYVASEIKLGAHHLAYLRAIAEGLGREVAAQRYLGHDVRDGAVALRRQHQAIVDQVRALARRQGERRWRLVGLEIRPVRAGEVVPTADEWASAQGLDEFSQAEVLALHAEAFPTLRQDVRNGRLRGQQLDLLLRLSTSSVGAALPHHRLDDWLAPNLSRRLMASGLLLLSDLVARVQMGGRWWSAVPGIGERKAGRLVQLLEALLPGSTRSNRSRPVAARGQVFGKALALAPPADRPALPCGSEPSSAAVPVLGRDIGDMVGPVRLHDDLAAVRLWLRARSGSEATAKSYRRELGRFLLFLDQRGRSLRLCDAEDCLAYMALLQNVPSEWMGKRTAPLGHVLWSPFAGALSLCSQQHAVTVVSACFSWLVSARYLDGNPWVLVNRRTGDDRRTDELASRAFAPAVWTAIRSQLQVLSIAEPGARRMVFLLDFLEATGLRAAELLEARLGDIRLDRGRSLLQVHGKGSRNRVIPLPGQAMRALESYLEWRGLSLEGIDQGAALPLLASLTDPSAPVSYRVLYGSMKSWLSRAISGTGLDLRDRVEATKASPHWLRHTCGTRALERGVPLDVVGQLLGHADPRTTAKYTRAQLERVSDQLEKAFG